MWKSYDNIDTRRLLWSGVFPCVIQGEDNLAEVKRRLELLENSQRPTVDSALEQLQMFIRAPSFSKERALDY